MVAILVLKNVQAQSILYKQDFDTIRHFYFLGNQKPMGFTMIKPFPLDSSIGYFIDTTGGNSSSGYTTTADTASGLNNLVIKNNSDTTGTYDLISPSISTVGDTGIYLIWASRISTNFTTSGSAVPMLYYSINNGSTWAMLPHTESAGGSVWGLVNNGSPIRLPVNASNHAALQFKWSTYIVSAGNGTYRFDDIKVTANGHVIPCDTVLNFTISNITSNAATLNWTAIANASGYTIQYKLSSSGTWTTVTSTTNSYTLSGLNSNATYQVKIETNCNNLQNSNYSSVQSFTTPFPVCSVPSGLSATSITTTSATLSWSSVASAVNYNVQYKVYNAGSWTTVVATTNTQALSSLTPSTKYYFQIQSNCGGGNLSNYSTIDSFTTLTPCGVPTNLSATAITSNSATLNWNAVSGATNYNVQYKIFSAGSWTTVVSATNSYSLTGLNANTKYYFQIQCNCGSGNLSNYSVADSFTTLIPVCNVPTGLNATSITYNSATLNWSAVASAVSYNVQYKIYNAGSWTTAVSATNAYALSGLSFSTKYYFQIQSNCGGGNSSNYSTKDSFTTAAPPVCNVPTSLSASSITASTAQLNWNNVASATSYNVQYKLSSGSTWTTVVSASNAYLLTGLAAATSYDFQVQANCGGGNLSNYSSPISFFTLASIITCGVPQSLSASSITSTSAQLNWAIVGGILNYNLSYEQTGTGTWTTIVCATNFYALTGLTPNTNYQFMVQSNCGSGNISSFSAALPFVTLATNNCDAPNSLINVTNISATSAKINWQGVSNATSYNVEYKPSTASTWSTASTGYTSITISGLTPSTIYDYQIQSNCGGGNLSNFSAQNNFTTNSTTGIEQLTNSNEQLSIYPNPASTELRIKNDELRIEKVEVVNMLGSVVLRNEASIIHNSPYITIDISTLSNGVYFIKATDDNGFKYTTKFVKQ